MFTYQDTVRNFNKEKGRALMRAIYLSALLILAAGLNCPARAQAAAGAYGGDASCGDRSAKILILGTYHMDNPGQDAINIQADDVLAPKRQREINDLLDKLALYKPTKIVIEAPYRSTYWTDRYQKYLAGELKLGRNEIEQIGFQLAKRVGLSTLHPIDFPMWMNGLMPNEREEPKVKPTPAPTPAEPRPALPPHLARKEELMRTATVTEILRYLNSDPYIRADHAGYMEMLLPNDSIAIYGRTDLITNWYKRNLRMFTNINRVTDFPGDRVLLLVGSGHLKILKDFALDAPYFCLVDAEAYLK